MALINFGIDSLIVVIILHVAEYILEVVGEDLSPIVNTVYTMV